MISWLRDKFGRVVTVVGSFSMIIDMIPSDVSPIAGYIRGIAGDKPLSVIGILCFMLSFARHQQIANRVNKLEQQQK